LNEKWGKYVEKSDYTFCGMSSVFLTLITAIITDFKYGWMIIALILSTSFVLLITSLLLIGKREERLAKQKLTDLNLIETVEDLKQGTKKVKIVNKVEKYHEDYIFYDEFTDHMFTLRHIKVSGVVVEWEMRNRFKKYCEEETNKVIEKLKSLIAEENGSAYKKEKMNSLPISYSDEITKEIDELLLTATKLSETIKNDLELKHKLVENIPSDLKEIRDVYLSFSDEGKEKNRQRVLKSLFKLKIILNNLEKENENKKENELSKIEERIERRYKNLV